MTTLKRTSQTNATFHKSFPCVVNHLCQYTPQLHQMLYYCIKLDGLGFLVHHTIKLYLSISAPTIIIIYLSISSSTIAYHHLASSVNSAYYRIPSSTTAYPLLPPHLTVARIWKKVASRTPKNMDIY